MVTAYVTISNDTFAAQEGVHLGLQSLASSTSVVLTPHTLEPDEVNVRYHSPDPSLSWDLLHLPHAD